jgi:uncharacterized cupredoxin-like copper-binding protein
VKVAHPGSTEGSSPHPSRAPVYIVIGGLALAFTLVFLAVAGAQKTAPPPAIARAGTPEAPRDVTIIMREYAFAPAPLALVPGETVRLTVLDGGLVAHDLVLGDATVQAAWSSADAAATPPAPFATPPPAGVPAGTAGLRVLLSSGQQSVVTYLVPRDQQLTMVCHIPGHRDRGMEAAVVLVSSAAASDDPSTVPLTASVPDR